MNEGAAPSGVVLGSDTLLKGTFLLRHTHRLIQAGVVPETALVERNPSKVSTDWCTATPSWLLTPDEGHTPKSNAAHRSSRKNHNSASVFYHNNRQTKGLCSQLKDEKKDGLDPCSGKSNVVSVSISATYLTCVMYSTSSFPKPNQVG